MSFVDDLSTFEHPPPGWFSRYLDAPPEPWDVDFEGSPIRAYRCNRVTGSRSAASIVLSHGFLAHAHCLSFLGPLLDRFEVVAYDSTGMGDSPMHPDFEPAMRGRELLAVAEDAGLLDGRRPVYLVAHSQGGHSAMSAIEAAPGAFAGLVVCDMMMMPQDVAQRYMRRRRGGLKGELQRDEKGRLRPREPKPHRVQPDLESILGRYVLAPPQPCETPFLLEWVARHSVRAVEGGYVWKFDSRVRVSDGHPLAWWAEQPPRFAALDLPKAIIYGEKSSVFPAAAVDFMRELAGPGVPVVPVPEAHHHLMLDQPIAFAATVAAMVESLLALR